MKGRLRNILFLTVAVGVGAPAFAWWGPHPWGPPPPHHWHGDGWGRGGCNFWPGFVGGAVAGLVMNAASRPVCQPQTVVVQQPVVQQPVIVQQPVVQQPVVVQQQPVVVQQPATVTQSVWVEGHYVDQPQGNGTVVRVWQPGHYESRATVVR